MGVRILDVDAQFYEKLAHVGGKTLNDTIRDSLTAYRCLMEMPGVAIFKSVPELRGELVAAYEAGTALQVPNNATSASPKKKDRTETRTDTRTGPRSARRGP